MEVEIETRFGYMNWRPDCWASAIIIEEYGGPLVHPDTGGVVAEAKLRPDLWTRLVPLPAGASPHTYPTAAEAEAAPPYGRPTGRSMEPRDPASAAPKPSTADAFALALAA